MIPFRIFLKGVIVKPQLYIFLYSQKDTYFKVISKATRASSNKISDDLISNIQNGSNGFKLIHINMYILHVYLHVKEYVADITFSIILKVKVPTFRSLLLRKGSQTVPRRCTMDPILLQINYFPYYKES